MYDNSRTCTKFKNTVYHFYMFIYVNLTHYLVVGSLATIYMCDIFIQVIDLLIL